MPLRLPSELLLKIFVELQTEHFWRIGREKLPICWAISQVCSQWRTVALESSRLWNRVPLESHQWTRACLTRSRSSSIEVVASIIIFQDYEERKSLRLIYPELPRVSLLEFCTETNYEHSDKLLDEVFAGLASRPAPMLRKLKFSLDDSADSDQVPVPLPTFLFARERLVSLEEADFVSCHLRLSWSQAFLPPSLRSLNLHNCLAWADIDEMVQFFELVPNLRSLKTEVINYETHHVDTSTSTRYPYRATALPHLRKISLTVRYLEQIALLAYVSMPTSTALDLHLREGELDIFYAEEDELAEDIRLQAQVFRDHFAPAVSAGHGYTHVELSAQNIRASYARPKDDTAGDTTNADHHDPAVLASIWIPFIIPRGKPSLRRPAYAALLQQPIFETVTNILVGRRLPLEAWSCCERWTAVETLEFSHHTEGKAFPGFAAAIHRQDFRLFPMLRDLRVENAVIVEASRDSIVVPGEPVKGEDLTGTDAQEFLAAVRELAKYEHFERLILDGCTMNAQTFQAVKDILGASRVEGDEWSPEEEIQAREEEKRGKDRWFESLFARAETAEDLEA